MDRNAYSTTVVPEQQFLVKVQFFPGDSYDHANQCGDLCCFNEKDGCPADLGDHTCIKKFGHWRVVEIKGEVKQWRHL